jgi:hypothetical protein
VSNISVAEILRIYRKWAQASEFEEFISQKLKISIRHAHNLVKKATSNGEIMRVELPNRNVIYGLAEFGPIIQTHQSSSVGREGVGIPKPERHLQEIADGVLALVGASKYRAEDKPYPRDEFMGSALLHIKTGYPEVYHSVLEMANWRPACLKRGVKKSDRCMHEYGQAREAFSKHANILIQRLNNGIEELDTSWCEVCEGMQGKTISVEDTDEVKNLLRIIWNVAI